MATKRLPRPRDPAQLAKLIVDIATGEVEDRVADKRDPAKAKGGEARARALTGGKRREIAKKAAKARWATRPVPVSEE